jgi:hypothetical protein
MNSFLKTHTIHFQAQGLQPLGFSCNRRSLQAQFATCCQSKIASTFPLRQPLYSAHAGCAGGVAKLQHLR